MHELVEQFSLQLVLVKAGTTGSHGPAVGPRGQLAGTAHQSQFRRALAQSQFMQQWIEIDYLSRDPLLLPITAAGDFCCRRKLAPGTNPRFESLTRRAGSLGTM